MKNTLLILLVVVLFLLAICVLPIGYFVYDREQRYTKDVDALKAIAVKLGYSQDKQLRLYGTTAPYNFDYNLIYLVFYSQDSLEQFSNRVRGLGYIQKYYYDNYTNIADHFLFFHVNGQSSEKVVTLNGRYKPEDFTRGASLPLVTTWMLVNSEKRQVDVYYARAPTPQDAWLFDGKKLSGNIVVVELHRFR